MTDSPVHRKLRAIIPIHDAGAGMSQLTTPSRAESNDTAKGPADRDWAAQQLMSGSAHDPFLSNDRSAKPFARAKMSGSAARFEPASFVKPHSSYMAILNRGSVMDDEGPMIVRSTPESDSQVEQFEDARKKANQQMPIGTRNGSFPRDSTVYFTTDMGPLVGFMGGHYMKLENVFPAEFDQGMSQLNTEFEWDRKIRGQSALPFQTSNKSMTILLCFDDFRHAADVDHQVSMIKASWNSAYISQTEYATAITNTSMGTHNDTDFFDGQAVLIATFEGSMSQINTQGVRDAIWKISQEYGEVMAFKDIAQPSSPAWEFRVEYYKISAAEKLLASLTVESPVRIGDWSVASRRYYGQARSSHVGDVSHLQYSATPQKSHAPSTAVFCSPTGRTAWSRNPDGSLLIEPPVKTVPKVVGSVAGPTPEALSRERFRSEPSPVTADHFLDQLESKQRSNSWAAPLIRVKPSQPNFGSPGVEAQSVTREKILSGQDVRTTLMLRNLPNSWDIRQLKAVLDVTSKGRYDFSYLRIDFAHNTNVGYAFVNFIDAMSIVDFIDRYVGNEWQPGGLKKLAQVSYATIQGFDCLIEKFRNSAIMDEFPDFRPKLWWTQQTAPQPFLVGQEKEFPPPNNLSKKQRSNDNAGEIGLYAPRSGQRGSDRYRRSQYDRGTTAQIREDAVFLQMSPSRLPGPRDPRYITNEYCGPTGPAPPSFPQSYGTCHPNHHMIGNTSSVRAPLTRSATLDGIDPFRSNTANGQVQPNVTRNTSAHSGCEISPSQQFAALNLGDFDQTHPAARSRRTTVSLGNYNQTGIGASDGFQGWVVHEGGYQTAASHPLTATAPGVTLGTTPATRYEEISGALQQSNTPVQASGRRIGP